MASRPCPKALSGRHRPQQPAAGRASEFNASGAGQATWATTGVHDQIVKSYWKRGTRWHDTTTGTWTSIDPITYLNDANRANPHTYAKDDPVNQFDPAGEDWWNPYSWGPEANCALNTAAFAVTLVGTLASTPTTSGLATAGGAAMTMRAADGILRECSKLAQ